MKDYYNETVEEVSFVGYYGTRVSVRKDNEEVSQYFDMLYLREDNKVISKILPKE